MNTATIEILKFSVQSSPTGDSLIGTWGYAECVGFFGIQAAEPAGGCSGYLGSESVGGTITAALRQFNLPTSRAPGDWPTVSVNGTVRY